MICSPTYSNAEKEKLSAAQPSTLGAAGRIPGITPFALMYLLKFVTKLPKGPEKGFGLSLER